VMGQEHLREGGRPSIAGFLARISDRFRGDERGRG
jgi:hypothetical protein